MSLKMWYYWNFLPDMIREIDQLSDEEIKKRYINKIADAQIKEREEKIPDIINRLKGLKATHFVLMNEFLMDQFKEALYNYVNGLDLSCISVCGILAEDIVLDLFENADIKVNGNDLTIEHKRLSFSKLSQQTKIEILLDFAIITHETAGKLDQIRSKRNEFVHPKLPRKANENDSLVIMNLLTEVIHKVYGQNYITAEVLIKFIQSIK